MPKLIPVQTITVGRDGKSVVPTIGQPFDFTEQEAAEIAAMNPAAVREPIVETAAAQEVKPAAVQEAKPAGKKKADAEL